MRSKSKSGIGTIFFRAKNAVAKELLLNIVQRPVDLVKLREAALPC